MKSIKIYNTLTRKKEIFKPLKKGRVGLYTCGPTVYNYAHIGNLRTYIFEDVLRRTLERAGYKVKHVMNITDVGHLTSDADQGEDKLEKGARREGKSVWDITKFYTEAFIRDIERLNIKKAHKLIPATSEIAEQIKIIKQLFVHGYAYETPKAVYFDVSAFGSEKYTKLSKQKISRLVAGARTEVVTDAEKRNPYDFALWFKTVGRFEKHIMRWPSPWGEGFPGWHIECSAISSKYLGQPFDIHTGGVDHINIHHTNEIAQSEGAFKKPLARVWMHGEFLLIDAAKMSKSGENFFTLESVARKGMDPLTFRYLVFSSHYRSKLNFTWESLAAAEQALRRLREFVQGLLETKRTRGAKIASLDIYKKAFDAALLDDLNTSKALSVVWSLVKDFRRKPGAFDPKKVRMLMLDFDKVLAFGLKNVVKKGIPPEIYELAEWREALRRERKWDEADAIRDELAARGYGIEDTPEGPRLKKN